MLINGDTSCLTALSLEMKMQFCRSKKLTEMNNMVTSPNELIYA